MQWLTLTVLTVTAHFSFPVSHLISHLISHFFIPRSWFYQFLQNFSSVMHILVDEYDNSTLGLAEQ